MLGLWLLFKLYIGTIGMGAMLENRTRHSTRKLKEQKKNKLHGKMNCVM